MAINLDEVLARLSPAPGHFGHEHLDIARAVAAVAIRARTLDEAVWLQIQRYASHRVKWNELELDLATDVDEADKGFGSAKVQQLSYLDKVLTLLEKELLLTPMVRKEHLGTEQGTFLDLLEGDDGPEPDARKGAGGVTPFRPRRRAIGG